MNLDILRKKAKKHKKFLDDQVIINPFSYMVNNVGYYVVIYQRGNKARGYSVISESAFVEADAKKAFEKLAVFTGFGKNFFEIEEAKMKLSPESFSNIHSILEEYLTRNDNQYLLKGKEIISKLEKLLRELQGRIQEYIQHYDDTILVHNRIDENEMRILWETLSHLNRLQYLQGKELIDNFEELKKMYKEMTKLHLDKKLSKYDQTVLKELTKDIKDTERTIKSLDIEKEIAHLPVEEQIEILVKEFEKAGREHLPRYKQDLRYPKP